MKTELYQLGAFILRNIGGNLGLSLRRVFYRVAGAKIGKGVIIRENVMIYRPYNLELGDYSELGFGTVVSAVKQIKISKHVGIGPYCAIYDNNHKMPKNEKQDNLVTSSVSIGDGSWIGTHSVILMGVKIGKNVTVGAGSLVNNSIKDNSVALGNPARVIKFNSTEIKDAKK